MKMIRQRRNEGFNQIHWNQNAILITKDLDLIYKNETAKLIFGNDLHFPELKYVKKYVQSKLENSIFEDIIEIKYKGEHELVNTGICKYEQQQQGKLYFLEIYAQYLLKLKQYVVFFKNQTKRYKEATSFTGIKNRTRELNSPSSSTIFKRRNISFVLPQRSRRSQDSASQNSSSRNSNRWMQNKALSLELCANIKIINKLRKIQSDISNKDEREGKDNTNRTNTNYSNQEIKEEFNETSAHLNSGSTKLQNGDI